MRKSTMDKLGSISTFKEPHEPTVTKTGASAVQPDGKKEPAGDALGHPHNNLGKFLHPKKSGYTPNLGKPAHTLNKTVDANTGGARVRPTQ